MTLAPLQTLCMAAQTLLRDVLTTVVDVAKSDRVVDVYASAVTPSLLAATKSVAPVLRSVHTSASAVDVLCKRVWPAVLSSSGSSSPELYALFDALMALAVTYVDGRGCACFVAGWGVLGCQIPGG